MKLFGSIKELVSAVFRKDTYEITLRPNQSTTYTAARDVQLPAKDGNAVLVSSGDIVNADISASAAIAYSKLALSNSIVNADVSSSAAIAYSKLSLSGSIVNADISNTAAIADTKLATISTAGKVANSATTATSANTASAIVARDASGNFSAGTITATLSGNATNVTGTVAIANGGTGQTTQQAALNALAGATTANRVLRGDGTNISLSQVGLTTDVTGILPVANGGTGISSLGSGVATFLGTPSSANLASAVTDETGSGSLVFGTGPTLSAPQVNSSLVIQQIATPSNPSAGFNKIYTKSDGILYKLDSSGNEVAVGSSAGGSGEINAVLNPSAATDTSGWAAGTSHTVTKDSANSPLSPVVSTSFALSSSAAIALGSQTSTSGVYDAITLPSGLQNRKLKVEFFFTTPASSAGTWAVAVYQGSTKVSLSTDSSGDTILPAGVTGGKFVAYFDTTSSASYSLNLVQRARTSANTLYITNVIVGPGIQPQGAVVGEWQSYTDTVANGGTAVFTYTSRQWRRVGDSIEIMYDFSVTTAGSGSSIVLIPLPAGLSIDTTKAPNGDLNLGHFSRYNGSTNTAESSVRYVAATSTTALALQKTGGTGVYLGSDLALNTVWYVKAVVPIAQWAGSGTVQLAQNDVEYASNSGNVTAAGGSDTTNFAYGPNGTPFLAYNSTTASGFNTTKFRVQFQTPIQATDTLQLEVLPPSSSTWLPSEKALVGYFIGNTAIYGARLVQISSTQVNVEFGNAGQSMGGISTVGSAGDPWSSLATNGWRWRVRKSSAGAAVGFGLVQPGVSAGLVSASGLAGNTTGNAIASGFVGELQEQTWGSVTIGTTSTTLATVTNLTTGTYLVLVNDYGNKGSSTGIRGAISGTTATISISLGDSGWFRTTVDSGANWSSSYFCRVTVGGSVVVSATSFGASATSHSGQIQFIRIA